MTTTDAFSSRKRGEGGGCARVRACIRACVCECVKIVCVRARTRESVCVCV